MKKVIFAFLFSMILSSAIFANEPSTIITSIIKARPNPSLVLNPKLLELVEAKEKAHGAQKVGAIVKQIRISRSMASSLGYLPLEGQTQSELKGYPELCKWMKENNLIALPDFRLNLIRGDE
jgi:hypothetical protein